jgi:hypothetical protein
MSRDRVGRASLLRRECSPCPASSRVCLRQDACGPGGPFGQTLGVNKAPSAQRLVDGVVAARRGGSMCGRGHVQKAKRRERSRRLATLL